MATFTGSYLGTERIALKLNLVTDSDGVVPSLVTRGELPEGLVAGGFVNKQPVAEFVHRYTGNYLWSFFEDYYNHIYIIPASVDFGTISTNTFQTVIVWNAYLTAQRLNSISPPVDTSITHSGLPTPVTFRPLEMRPINIHAAAQGSAIVNTHMMFNFEGLSPFRLNISGIRARFWEWSPNWRDGVSTVLEYKTDIFTSRSGKEMRSALRDFPRRSISFTTLANDGQMREFQRYMVKWFNRPALMPAYGQSTVLTETAQQGDTYITLAEVPNWMTPQTNIVFMLGEKSEIKSVLNVSGNRVNLTASITDDWPMGTSVYYGVSGRLSTSVRASALTNRVLSVPIKFDGEPGSEQWPVVPPAPRTLGDYELFMLRPNYAASVSMDFAAVRDVVDFGIGTTFTYSPHNFESAIYQNEYHCYSQGEIDDLVNFFRRMLGQQGEFYAPTWTEDVRMMIPTVPNTANIRVAGQEFAADYGDSTMYKYLMISLRDGRQLIREVVQIFAISDSIGNDSNIQMTEQWNEEITPDMVNQISWVMRCRLASDGITISYRTSTVATINLSIKTLEVLA